MTKDEYESFIRSELNDLLSLMHAKNEDYAEGDDFFANFRQSAAFGVDPLVGLFVRLGDKISRIQSFCRRGTLLVEGEGLDDALRDVIGYSLLALAYQEEVNRESREEALDELTLQAQELDMGYGDGE